MMTKTPTEQGWYWCEDASGYWYMAFFREVFEWVTLISADYGKLEGVYSTEELNDPALEIKHWFGPIHCPGGGGPMHTVVVDHPTHKLAKQEGKAIVMTHVDYRHCRDDGSKGRVTDIRVCSREEAGRSLRY